MFFGRIRMKSLNVRSRQKSTDRLTAGCVCVWKQERGKEGVSTEKERVFVRAYDAVGRAQKYIYFNSLSSASSSQSSL